MKKGKSFDNLLTDLHSEPLPDAALPALSLQSEGVSELSSISAAEAHQLAQYERIIEEGLTTFLSVGNALMAIRQEKLYRATHRTFEAYCRERFGLKRQRAYELIGAAEVVNSLAESDSGTIMSEISDKSVHYVLPERESHASVLADLSPAERRTVWQQVIEKADVLEKPITASLIKETKKQLARPSAVPSRKKSKEVQKTEMIRRIRKAAADQDAPDVRVEIQGSWLLRHGLAEIWSTLRGRPDWVITETFTDSVTWLEARQLGLLSSK
ncbi:hypothetical protein LX87_04524 [Larkinella arboricola]|uniref:Uncharacterized protein n=1 Tax=Larkinella arboricola TaxID=643671 RepID=A0A327WQ98_LARAB|nr:hypothetical protein [Larkinella arboricola]RAJ93012.1 hypothetical protein LX87_04524 [Larkinella arboricola]